uniref:Secreted protein n=1 Tax=Strombidium inclinatum TaxID=197538 RepID=A0A7S3IHC3_9SPIT|mmetsp:Transcript_18974/g.29103  ORF Transcript_18974/g.29103 Transcript_18974/m.29103 type:complete len:326 (+) Transcript_18974:133-1110(+)
MVPLALSSCLHLLGKLLLVLLDDLVILLLQLLAEDLVQEGLFLHGIDDVLGDKGGDVRLPFKLLLLLHLQAQLLLENLLNIGLRVACVLVQILKLIIRNWVLILKRTGDPLAVGVGSSGVRTTTSVLAELQTDFCSELGLGHSRVIPLDGPIVDEFILIALADVQLLKYSLQVVVVRVLGKAQVSAVSHVLEELLWAVSSELFDSHVDLSFLDFLVLLVLRLRLQTLPGQFTFQEIEQNIPSTFQVVSSALLNSDVSVGTSIPRCASQAFALLIRNMLTVRLLPLLSKAIVDQKESRGVVIETHQDIFRLEVSVNIASIMEHLNS